MPNSGHNSPTTYGRRQRLPSRKESPAMLLPGVNNSIIKGPTGVKALSVPVHGMPRRAKLQGSICYKSSIKTMIWEYNVIINKCHMAEYKR